MAPFSLKGRTNVNMRPKIVILTYSLGGAGAERVVANLLNGLDRNRYDVRLVLMNNEIEYSIPAGLPIHYIEQSNRYENEYLKFIKLPLLAYRFARYCKAEKIDLVLSVMNRPNLIATMARRFGLTSKVLISERCYSPFTYNKETLSGRIKQWLLQKHYPLADAILPNSQGTAEALEKIYGIRSHYHVVRNPTDIAGIRQKASLPVDVAVDFSRFTFIYAATFRPEKNQRMLIEAADALRDYPFQLLLIGKGELLQEMKALVAERKLADKIQFIDFTNNPYRYMQRSHCFVLPSLSEGFPNVLIESMALGLPIVSVDCKTGPRELLAPGTDLDTPIAENSFEKARYGILTADRSLPSLIAGMRWALENPADLQAYIPLENEKAPDFEIKKVVAEFSTIFDSYLKL